MNSTTADTHAKPKILQCAVDALQSNASYIAYTHLLYQKALELESRSNASNKVTLFNRRPDLPTLLMDKKNLEEPCSALVLIVNTLTQKIRTENANITNIKPLLSKPSQRADLPYHYAHEQCKSALQVKNVSRVDLLLQTEYSFPSFCFGQLRTEGARKIMRSASGFAPALQEMLLLSPVITYEEAQHRYGVTDLTDATKWQLKQLPYLQKLTGVKQEEILELLLIDSLQTGRHACTYDIKRSDAYLPSKNIPVDNRAYGARYLHASTKSCIGLTNTSDGTLRLENLSPTELGLLYQVIHLQRELRLPFADIDTLLISIIQAEGNVKEHHITPNTLRAIGMFRYLNDTYNITVEQFSALICELTVYSRADQTPFLDRVLDGPRSADAQGSNASLLIDNREFDPDASGEEGTAAAKIIAQLSKSLGVDQTTTLSLLALVKRELKLKKLKLSLPLISSLYRLSQLPRLLNRSYLQGSALIKILDTVNPGVIQQLAGIPSIQENTAPDILDVLLGLTCLDQWLRQHDVTPAALLPVLTNHENTILIPGSAHEALLQDCLVRLRSPQVDQQDILRHLLLALLENRTYDFELTSAHISPLLRWANVKPKSLSDNVLKAGQKKGVDQPCIDIELLTLESWPTIVRYAHAIRLFRLSPAAITALCDHPELFNFDEAPEAGEEGDNEQVSATTINPALDLDLCYQLSRYQDWVTLCKKNGFMESDATDYLKQFGRANAITSLNSAAGRLSSLLGWTFEETLLAAPVVVEPVSTDGDKTLNNFMSTLKPEELAQFRKWTAIIHLYKYSFKSGYNYQPYQNLVTKLHTFMEAHTGPLKVTHEQMSTYGDLERHKRRSDPQYFTPEQMENRHNYAITFEVYTPGPIENTETPCAPTTVTDIDYVMRLQNACKITGLSCESLLDLVSLDESSAYDKFELVANFLLASCTDDERATIDDTMLPCWRDALASHLLTHAYLYDNTLPSPTGDPLCHYFLADIWCSTEARTTRVMQAIASLQQYIRQHITYVEQGYAGTEIPESTIGQWQATLGDYRSWQRWQSQQNHLENLISYSNRPQKSKPFQELEVEINQGRLDTSMLEAAICNYLSKFERLCNLQVVSGYLDGKSPTQDTYHLIGKTNTAPAEYYWRSINMGIFDSSGRLSPMAWTEWERINIPASSQMTRSHFSYSKGKYDEPGNITIDNIRPVMVAGRKYVVWVERETRTKDESETIRRLKILYSFLQADGTWSTVNELFAIDSEKLDALKKGNKSNLSLDEFNPRLILTVTTEGERSEDPWLTIMLYHGIDISSDPTETVPLHCIKYFDLLFLEKNHPSHNQDSHKTLYNSFKDPRTIQGVFDGAYNTCTTSPPQNEKRLSDDSRSVFVQTPASGDDVAAFNITAQLTTHNTLKIQASYVHSVKQSIELPDGRQVERRLELIRVVEKEGEIVIATKAAPHGVDPVIECEIPLQDEVNIIARYHIDEDIILDGTACKVTVTQNGTDEPWRVLIDEYEGTQYLSLEVLSFMTLKPSFDPVRLNTLLGKDLARLANNGFKDVMQWSTQNLPQRLLLDASEAPMDFHGANGLYLHELFLHLPFMIANRLTEQGQYWEAESWYFNYLFHPYQATADSTNRPAPWRTRPLITEDFDTSHVATPNSDDLTLKAYMQTDKYRLAIILALIENWRLQGDHHYRQLTTDNLERARCCYENALSLLEKHFKDDISFSYWEPVSLADCKAEMFHQPRNPRVSLLHDTLESRLSNLRHGLSLNGRRIGTLSLGAPDARSLLPKTNGISIQQSPLVKLETAAPAYRFRQLLPGARQAAERLLDFGRHYMHLMEVDYETELSVLLMRHTLTMSDFTLRLEQESINTLHARRETLSASRSAVAYRRDFHRQLIDDGLSSRESEACLLGRGASALKTCATLITVSEGVTKLLPNTFGLANGGMDFAGPFTAMKEALSLAADSSALAAEQLLVQESFQRREQQWLFELKQAELDIVTIDREIAELEIELKAATINRDRAVQERANLDEAYTFMTTGFTIAPVYQWLIGRQELIYSAAYDAVLSICQTVELAWRYEIADYNRGAFIKTSGWNDSYKGMLAGESLLVDLQEMENAYLRTNERRLTTKKVISLKALKGSDWSNTINNLSDGKPISFELLSQHFDQNYPGHYLRQIKHVSLSFVTTGSQPIGTPHGILTQVANTVLTEMDVKGLDYLYKKSTSQPESIKRNLRHSQQVAISSLSEDDGLGYPPGQWVFELMFHDGRYLPFEGTGAISDWELEMTDTHFARQMKDCIYDIHINIVYTAKPGDASFVKALQKIRNSDTTSYDTAPTPVENTDDSTTKTPKKHFPTGSVPDAGLT